MNRRTVTNTPLALTDLGFGASGRLKEYRGVGAEGADSSAGVVTE